MNPYGPLKNFFLAARHSPVFLVAIKQLHKNVCPSISLSVSQLQMLLFFGLGVTFQSDYLHPHRGFEIFYLGKFEQNLIKWILNETKLDVTEQKFNLLSATKVRPPLEN